MSAWRGGCSSVLCVGAVTKVLFSFYKKDFVLVKTLRVFGSYMLYYCCSLKCSRKEWTFTSKRESLVYPFFRDGQTTHSMFPFIQLTCFLFFSRLLLCEIKYYFSNKTDSFAVLSGFELSCLFCQCMHYMESKKEWKCRRKM